MNIALSILFCSALFLSAFLLFVIQPIMGKIILPTLGGTPAVWNGCMLFFQAELLLGYFYPHLLRRFRKLGLAVTLHLCVMVVALFVLPAQVLIEQAPSQSESPLAWMLWWLTLNVGFPFFVISTSAPLLQYWFSRTTHRLAKDPYFLYAASNIGSLCALLFYPILIEPALPLKAQLSLWQQGYSLLVIVVGMCALTALRSKPQDTKNQPAHEIAKSVPLHSSDRRQALYWLFCSFVPSSLMLGTTTYITTNIAPVPLLWVIPLAIYLTTFILVFSNIFPRVHPLLVRYIPLLIIPLAPLVFCDLKGAVWIGVALQLFVFFILAMLCHGELARTRPAADRLTFFYLMLSLGGVLGGIFNSIVAPNIFHSIVELPLAIALACFARPADSSQSSTGRDRLFDYLLPLLLLAFSASFLTMMASLKDISATLIISIFYGVPAVLCYSFRHRPLRFGLGFASIFLTFTYFQTAGSPNILYAARNFYGVKKVLIDPKQKTHTLTHGNTFHGAQKIEAALACEPIAYFHRTGPVGDIFSLYRDRELSNKVAIIGLGTGAMSAYARSNEAFHFYEIDPLVVAIARDERFFSYLSRCGSGHTIFVGDGRLQLSQAPRASYELIFVDAFSSDSIPAHLLTKEAVQLYLEKLNDDGLIIFQISNRYLNFEPLLAKMAADLGIASAIKSDTEIAPELIEQGKAPSVYLVVARKEQYLQNVITLPGWRKARTKEDVSAWTDQYSSIWSVLY